MQNYNKNIDKLFRDKLNDFEADVPSFVWDNITEKLDNKKRIRALYYISGIAASVLILIAFGAGYLLTQNTMKQPVADNVHQKQQKKMEQKTDNSAAATRQKSITTEMLSDNNNENLTETKTVENKQSNKNTIATTKEANSEKNENDHTDKNIIAQKHNNEPVLLQDAITPTVYSDNTTAEQGVVLTKGGHKLNAVNSDDNKIKEIEQLHITYLSPKTMQFAKAQIKSQTSVLDEFVNNYIDKDLEKQLLPIDADNSTLIANRNKYNDTGWSFGGGVSPLYATTEGTVAYPQETYMNEMASIGQADMKMAYNQSAANSINTEMNAVNSYSGGLNVQYKSEKRWAVQSGVYYSKRRKAIENLIVNSYVYNYQNIYYAQTALDEVYFDEDAANQFDEMRKTGEIENAVSGGYNQMIYQSDLDLVQSFDYIEIPLILKYALIDKRLDVHLLGGVSTDILVNNNILVVSNSTELWNGAQNNAKMLNYSSTIGVGVEYALTKRLSLTLQPSVRHLLSSNTAKNYNFPSSFACFTGLRFNLR